MDPKPLSKVISKHKNEVSMCGQPTELENSQSFCLPTSSVLMMCSILKKIQYNERFSCIMFWLTQLCSFTLNKTVTRNKYSISPESFDKTVVFLCDTGAISSCFILLYFVPFWCHLGLFSPELSPVNIFRHTSQPIIYNSRSTWL